MSAPARPFVETSVSAASGVSASLQPLAPFPRNEGRLPTPGGRQQRDPAFKNGSEQQVSILSTLFNLTALGKYSIFRFKCQVI